MRKRLFHQRGSNTGLSVDELRLYPLDQDTDKEIYLHLCHIHIPTVPPFEKENQNK